MPVDDIQKKYERLRQAVRSTVPYVTATISSGCSFSSEKRPDWMEIHKGRASSSNRQLEGLLRLANEEDENPRPEIRLFFG